MNPHSQSHRLFPLGLAALTLVLGSGAVADENYEVVAVECGPELTCQREFCSRRHGMPPADWPDANRDPVDAPLRGSSKSTTMRENVVEMQGEVELSRGNLRLRADSAHYDRGSEALTIEGNIELRQQRVVMQAERATVQTSDGSGAFENARLRDYDSGVRARAALIKRVGDQGLELRDTEYTTCEEDKEVWSLKATEIRLNAETGRGVARNTRVEILGNPVFYVPWMDFPIDDRRSSGLLWPTIASNNEGLDIALPYYINIAPDQDATVTPRLLSERGTMLEAEYRYLGDSGLWTFAGAGLDNDDKTGEQRWLIDIDQSLNDGHWRSEIRYTRVSDGDYFRDIGVESLSVQRSTNLLQQGWLEYNHQLWRAQLELTRYQSLTNAAEDYRRLPQFSFVLQPRRQSGRVLPILDLQYTDFDHRDAQEDGGTFVTGERHYAEAGFALPLRGQGWWLEPSLRTRHLRYDLNYAPGSTAESNPEVTSTLAMVDGGLLFERQLERGRWQSLEPRFLYVDAEHENQDALPLFDTTDPLFTYDRLFRANPFSGRDRLNDGQHVALGISSAIHQGERELLRAGIGIIRWLETRRVGLTPGASDTRDSSEIVAGIKSVLGRHSWLRADLSYDRDQDAVVQSGVMAHYNDHKGTVANLGYTLRDRQARRSPVTRNTRQIDLGFSKPVDPQWQVFVRQQYDLAENTSLESLVGVEYQDCCWMARLAWQRSLEPADNVLSNPSTNANPGVERDEALLLEFQLKGLGGVGTKVADRLEESIYGIDYE